MVRGLLRVLAVAVLFAPAVVHAAILATSAADSSGSNSLLNFNGSAQIAGARARLTNGGTFQGGTVWAKNQVVIDNFTSQFTFQLTTGSGTADGFTFAIQRAGNTPVGGTGGFLGTPASPRASR